MFTHSEHHEMSADRQECEAAVADGPEQRIRTYKTRRGRVTRAGQRALHELWPQLGLEYGTAPLDQRAIFGRDAPLVLEIGFGMGEATAALAAAEPDRDVLAVDVHTPGVGALLGELGRRKLTNVRLLTGDAVPLLQTMLLPGQLAEIRIFFPDPWPKSRHAKRRLMAPPFVRLAGSGLRAGGRLHLATDWGPYADQAFSVLSAEPLFDPPTRTTERPPWRPVTRFERRAIAAGRPVVDVFAVRNLSTFGARGDGAVTSR